MTKIHSGKGSGLGKRTLSIVIVGLMVFAPLFAGGFMLNGMSPTAAPVAVVNGGGVDIGADTVIIQPNTIAGKDAGIADGPYAYSNYGTQGSFWAGNLADPAEMRGLVQFDIPQVPGSILSATLSLYVINPYGTLVNCSAHAVNITWDEGTGTAVPGMAVNWTHATATTQWTNPGGDYRETPCAYLEETPINSWMNFNVTAIVDNWQDGLWPNHGFILIGNGVPAGANGVDWASSDNTFYDSSYFPKLTISYHAQIDPPVHNINLNEDDPTASIWLEGREHGTATHISGSVDGANYYPFDGLNQNQCRFQTVYTPDMVGAEGTVRRISFDRSMNQVGVYNNLVISLAHTELENLTTTFDNNYRGTLQNVFSENVVQLSSSNGDSWVHFDLTENFTYDSSFNLLLDLVWNGDDGVQVSIDTTDFPGTWDRRLYTWTGAATGTLSPRTPVTKFEVDVVDQISHQSWVTGASNTIPFRGASSDQLHVQYLYTPDQVGTEGMINSIAFERTSSSGATFDNFMISMAHTDLDQLTTTYDNNYPGNMLIEVFPSQTINLGTLWDNGKFVFNLNGNFTYDSLYNLLIDIQWNGDNGQSPSINTTNNFPNRRCFDDTGGATGTVDNSNPILWFNTDIVDNSVVDNGDDSGFYPFDISQTQFKIQWLYTLSELGWEKGIVDTLGILKTDPTNDNAVIPNFRISLAHTGLTSLTITFDSNYLGSLTDVYFDSSLDIESWNGWIDFDINDTFEFNGVDNLLVQIEWQGNATGSGDISTGRTSIVGSNRRVFDATGSATGTADTTRNHIRATYYDSTPEFTWSASSSEPWLFSATTVGNELRISPQSNAFGVGNATVTLRNTATNKTTTQRIPVTINPVNDPPEISGMPVSIMCTEDVDYVFNMSAYASDIDNTIDELTFTENSYYVTVDGMDIIFNYPEGVNNDSVTITVEDPDGLTDSYVLNVTVNMVNDPPTLIGFVDNITVDATVPYNYVMSPGDEETPGDISIYEDSAYGTVQANTISFLYPKLVGTETVTIYVQDGTIYGTRNNETYTLFVTVIDHPDVIVNTPTGTGVTLTTTVYVLFDVPMDRNLTEAAFTLSTPTRADIAGTFTWNADSNEMVFTPDEYLDPGLYNVVIGTGATDWHGAAMLQPFAWNFTADGNADADGDGMPDEWEIDMGLDPLVNDASGDNDGDGMPNLYEFQNGLNAALDDADADADGDGATNFEEYEEGTDPNDPEDKPAGMPWLIIILVLVVVVIVIVAALALSRRKPRQPDYPQDQPPRSPPPQGPQQAPPPEQPPPPQTP